MEDETMTLQETITMLRELMKKATARPIGCRYRKDRKHESRA